MQIIDEKSLIKKYQNESNYDQFDMLLPFVLVLILVLALPESVDREKMFRGKFMTCVLSVGNARCIKLLFHSAH